MDVITILNTEHTILNTIYRVLTKEEAPVVSGRRYLEKQLSNGVDIRVVSVNLSEDSIILTDGINTVDYYLSELPLSFKEVETEHDFF